MRRQPEKCGGFMHCGVCRSCEEKLDDSGHPTGKCIYGGPYEGYLMPDGTLEVVG